MSLHHFFYVILNMERNKPLIIIVSYNSMQWIERCYDSLRMSSVQCDVVTVDNGSTDETVDFIREHYPEVEIIENNSNLGFGRANNIGLQKVLDGGYEYVYLLNQDAWIKPDTIEKLVAVSKKHPEYGVLSPIQMQANEEYLDYGFANWVIGNGNSKRRVRIDDIFFDRNNDVYDVDFVMAAHWLMTRQCIETVGGFSPTFSHYGEDDNYLHRTKYWNFKIGIVPSCIAVHDREGREMTEEHSLYMNLYVNRLKEFSNPIAPVPMMSYVRYKLRVAVLGKNSTLLKYTWRIFKDRKQIQENFNKSKLPCAFLEKTI